jgi:hypothetical protein
MSENYEWELWVGIMSGNYDLVYNITWTLHGKVEIHRDTGVSKKYQYFPVPLINILLFFLIR